MNPEKALEDSKPLKVKEEPVSDIVFPLNEEMEADLASGDQALPIGVLGTSSERLAGGLEEGHSPHTSGTSFTSEGSLLVHKKYKFMFKRKSCHLFILYFRVP